MNFRLTKGNFLKTGAYIEGIVQYSPLQQKKRMNAALFYLINREILPV